jgi:two-component system response regulator RegA
MITLSAKSQGSSPSKFLIVDDNEIFLQTLERSMRRRGFEVGTATSSDAAMHQVQEDIPDRVVLDLNLGNESGLRLIPRLLDISPAMQIVVLTGYASIATAVEAIRLGAAHYLPKPADVDEILASFDWAADRHECRQSPQPSPMSVRQLEWEHLQRVLLEHDGNISSAARALGLHRRSLQRKLKKHAPA